MALTLTPVMGIPLIQPGDDVSNIFIEALEKSKIQLENGNILVVAQKIISKAEKRLVNLTTVHPSDAAIELAKKTGKDPRFLELVLKESKKILRTRIGTIVVEHNNGFICANAGIDHSNVNGSWGEPGDWYLLLPEDADRSARNIKVSIDKHFNINLGVLIIDSHGRAWRNGTIGCAIGLAGLPGVVDLRGKPDLFGFHLQISQVAAADELASAASLVMGQASEGVPLVHVSGFPYPLREGTLSELIRPEELDLFR